MQDYQMKQLWEQNQQLTHQIELMKKDTFDLEYKLNNDYEYQQIFQDNLNLKQELENKQLIRQEYAAQIQIRRAEQLQQNQDQEQNVEHLSDRLKIQQLKEQIFLIQEKISNESQSLEYQNQALQRKQIQIQCQIDDYEDKWQDLEYQIQEANKILQQFHQTKSKVIDQEQALIHQIKKDQSLIEELKSYINENEKEVSELAVQIKKRREELNNQSGAFRNTKRVRK